MQTTIAPTATTTTVTKDPLRGVKIDSPHYEGKSTREIWQLILEGFFELYRRALPTQEEIGNAFERGMTPAETWHAIYAARKSAVAVE